MRPNFSGTKGFQKLMEQRVQMHASFCTQITDLRPNLLPKSLNLRPDFAHNFALKYGKPILDSIFFEKQ